MNFKKMSLDERKKLYVKASYAYHNKRTLILTDGEFNALEDTIRAEEPTWKELHKTGVRTSDRKREITLNQFMPSLEKAYPEALPKFIKRIPIKRGLVMDKLDGTSLQLRYFNGNPKQLATRGDGEFGRNVSYFIDALMDMGRVPKYIKKAPGILDLRLEGVMQKKIFEQKWSRVVLGENRGAENARQLVNGVFLRNEPGEEIADIDFKVLGLYQHTMAEGLALCTSMGFDVVWWDQPEIPEDQPFEKYFTDLLIKRKERSLYEIDGLVLTHDDFLLNYKSADKPKEIFAFKVNNDDDAYHVRVLDIEYAKTRLGRISIVAVITPTRMDGVVVERVTVHNAAWMMERNIGPGARIKVLRSGGVIPKIVGVVEPGKFKAPPFPYKLDGRYFVVADNGHDRDIAIRRIHFFFTTLGIELLAAKTIDKLYEAGYKSINDYIEIVKDSPYMERIASAPGLTIKTDGPRNQVEAHRAFVEAGLGDKQAANALGELTRVLKATISLKKLMVASGRFDAGIGERKLSSLEDAGIAMREICNMSSAQIEEKLATVKGWSDKTIALMVAGVPRFRNWYKPLKSILTVDGTLPKKAAHISGKLGGLRIAFTGYRDSKQETKILQNGGILVSFGATTDILLYTADGRKSTKVEKAGDRAMLWDAFCDHYGIE